MVSHIDAPSGNNYDTMWSSLVCSQMLVMSTIVENTSIWLVGYIFSLDKTHHLAGSAGKRVKHHMMHEVVFLLEIHYTFFVSPTDKCLMDVMINYGTTAETGRSQGFLFLCIR